MPARREVRPVPRAGKPYFVRTFGCQMNEPDSERIGGLLRSDGMVSVDTPEDADVVVLNTCTIRENADQRLYGYLGSLKQAKDARPGMRIMVGGCMAQKDRGTIQERAGWVDVVFGTHNTHRVLHLLDHVDEWGPVTEVWEETTSTDDIPSMLPMERHVDHAAWVTITIGCNNSCTFCIVPSVRGREISRRPGDIISEVSALVADGVVEVTLLGQNVNSYGRDLELNGRKPLFADLLRRTGEVEGLQRVRYTSPHPKDFGEDVAVAMAETDVVCEQLHLPLQSGSDRVLAAMHRGYNAARFLDKLGIARDVIPGLAVSTDIIVGFPGETEEDFQATLDLVAEARFDSAFMFQFSPRPGTAAAEMTDLFVDPAVIQERFDRLVELQNRITFERNEEMVGQTYEVMVEGPSKRDPEMATTRTRGNKLVHVPGRFQPATVLEATIDRAAPHHLIGSVAP
ncbi:MAG: tRNA (N6-isopentenyl adenosine(37)-C2)-methylthiotransferase MiaB [Acidimicrobiia bacterium]|nr:tRNA (N6-isopentenyl adenosine(37)-C2)-methylthiotransferase MiaB [Acidimicrobiia bacterium]